MIEIASLSDSDLTERLKLLVADESRCLTAVLEHLAEFDHRKLHEDHGYCSSFLYCTKVLGYSEEAAYRRIHAAKLARKFPSILNRLKQGRITLNTIVLLGPHLSSDNHRSLLDWACGKTRQEIEKKVASLAPQTHPVSADVIRHLGPQPVIQPTEPQALSLFDSPAASAGIETQPASEDPPSSPPLAAAHSEPKLSEAQRVRFSFTGSTELLRKIERAREILRHKHPAGRLEDVIGEAIDVLLERKDPERRLQRKTALARSESWRCASEDGRRIPQRVKDEVWERDGGRCAFKTADGTRCGERGGLEFDHIVPFALGGPSHNPKNIRLLCRAHNQMLARRVFGEAAVDKRRSLAAEFSDGLQDGVGPS